MLGWAGLLHNSSGQFVWDNYANNHIYDHSNVAVQEYWMEICLNATNSGAADGCFADYASMGGFDPAAPGQPASVGVKGVMKSWNVRIPLLESACSEVMHRVRLRTR